MPDKNDLSAYKLATAKTLPRSDANRAPEATKVIPTPAAWRKPKPIAEKQSEHLSLRLTPSEVELLRKKAGLVPLATYVRHAIYEQTDLFGDK